MTQEHYVGNEIETAARAMRAAVRASVRKHRVLYLVQAALLMIGGTIALFLPILSSVTLVVVLGWLLILGGIVQGISLVGAQDVPHFWLQLISAVLGFVVGLLILRSPGEGLLAITLLLIVFLMIEGIAKVVFALTIRPLTNWGWILASGALGIALAAILWSSLPGTAAWLLGVLFGANLLAQGAALGAMALSAGRA